MLEFITRRRLIFGLAAFVFMTISLLFVAHLHSSGITRVGASYNSHIGTNSSADKEQQTSTCHLNEPVDVIGYCQKCTSYEHRYNKNGCSPTGYKELVLCLKSSIKTSRSCPIPAAIQKERFWIFEGIIFVIALCSIANVNLRQKALDKQMAEKIKRQIGESDE